MTADGLDLDERDAPSVIGEKCATDSDAATTAAAAASSPALDAAATAAASSPALDAATLRQRAAWIRRDILDMITRAKSGHPGGSLSAADIMATLYFGGILRHNPENPALPERDRFILSKGHAAPVLYATLAEAGYFPREELATLRKLGSRLQGHPDMHKLPGVEVSTGSLGQGLSIAAGLAYALRNRGESAQVFVLLGDGELQEGQIWEAILFAAHQGLGNLVAIIDNNGLQIDGSTDEISSLGAIEAKFRAFGWASHTTDGHDVAALHTALTQAKHYTDAPFALIAHTVKGKGVSFMENQCGWHGKAPSAEQCAAALVEVEQFCGPQEEQKEQPQQESKERLWQTGGAR
ncbi:MAG: transketolase [Coriobacteriales bacterium]|jgi:transketolase|nr:transketolase [Coriobacteriales bacterium]